MNLIAYAIFVVGAYLLGAIPFGLVIGLAKGVDIRKYGSGNTGATNAMRVIGRKWSAAVLLLDVLKAVLPVLSARLLVGDPWLAAACAVAVVMGHNWPVYIGFKGGKGVSSSLGVMLVLLPVPTLAAAVLCIGLIAWTRYVSLGSVVSTVAVPLAAVAYAVAGLGQLPMSYMVAIFMLAAMILVQHRGNIQRLLAGNERRLGERKSPLPEGEG